MVECRHCHNTFETPPETIGARCPDCRMPLFERLDRPRREVESGRCYAHAGVPGVAGCQRCQRRLCSTCRTRWHEQNLCPDCVEKSITAGEEHPREQKSRRTQAVRGFVLAVLGASLFVAGAGLLLAAADVPTPGKASWGVFLTIAALIPAGLALGTTSAVVLARGPLFRLASSAAVLAAGQIGLTVGLFLINLLRN